jgi:hypothetical protein
MKWLLVLMVSGVDFVGGATVQHAPVTFTVSTLGTYTAAADCAKGAAMAIYLQGRAGTTVGPSQAGRAAPTPPPGLVGLTVGRGAVAGCMPVR